MSRQITVRSKITDQRNAPKYGAHSYPPFIPPLSEQGRTDTPTIGPPIKVQIEWLAKFKGGLAMNQPLSLALLSYPDPSVISDLPVTTLPVLQESSHVNIHLVLRKGTEPVSVRLP